ncbi:MAG: enoyl-CoA hydratase [Actinobacteria bacterium]|nr:enoyl-CoA hydratase [Actinomycetota bacterium]
MRRVSDKSVRNDTVLYEHREPGIALLTLNRPDRLNAWTGELAVRYFALLDQAAADPAVKVIVITGAGRGFCAGADMDALQAVSGRAAEPADMTARRGPHETTLIPKPVIAAVNGACAGVGMVIALMCDIRFAATNAKFTTAFSRRGLVAEYGMSWILPRLVGTARAFDLLYSGRVILGDEAARMGLVNEAVAQESVLDHALAYAGELATLASPTSMAVMKRQVYSDWNSSLPQATAAAIELMNASLRRPDLQEGVASFLQKRSPNFGHVDPKA